MPGFAVFRPAAQIRHRVDAAQLHPLHERRAERGRERHIESAVAVKQGGRGAIQLQTFLIGQEQGHTGSVFAGIEHLFGFELQGIKREHRFTVDRAPAGAHVEMIDGSG